MYETLTTIHTWTGYLVFLVVVVVGVWGVRRARSGREFEATPFSLTMVAVDLQVTLGLVQYVVGQAWDFGAAIAWLHPAIMLAALGVGHAGIARARREQMADSAHRTAGQALLLVALVIAIGIGVVSAA